MFSPKGTKTQELTLEPGSSARKFAADNHINHGKVTQFVKDKREISGIQAIPFNQRPAKES